MKNLYNCIIIFCLCVLFASCTTKQKPDTENVGLKGKVKSVREVSYEAFGSADTLVQGEIVVTEESPNCYITYNPQGYISTITTYDIDNQEETSWLYHYDKKGTKLQSAVFFLVGHVLKDSVVYLYEKNRAVELVHYNDEQEIVKRNHRKFKQGNIIEERILTPDNSVEQISKYIYKKGRLIEGQVYSSDGKLTLSCRYKYDNKGNMLSTTLFDKDNTYTNKISYHYNAEGFPIVEVKQRAGYTTLQLNNIYVTDQMGNWTQRIMLCEDEAFKITKREIEYYN